MTTTRNDHLVQMKLALAEKYDRLAGHAKSKPRQRKLENRAGKYRHQVRELSRT